MNEKKEAPFLTDRAFQWLLHLLTQNRWGVLGCLIPGFLAYTFAFTNKLPNHDDVNWLFSKGTALPSGRWGLDVLGTILPDYSMPWIYGVLSLLLLTAAVCLILKLFRVENPMLQFLLAAVIITFPSQICTFTYMFTACAYAIAFLLSVLAVWGLRQEGWLPRLGAVVCCMGSASIYQAYIAITATLLILLLIRDLLTTEEAAGKLFGKGVGYVAALAAGLGSYWLVTRLLWRVTGTGMGEYADYAFTFSAATVAQGLKNAYIGFLDTFRYGYHGLIPTLLSRLIHYLCLLAAAMELGLWMVKDRRPGRIGLMLLLLLLLPLGINCMFLFITPDAIHTLVQYSYVGLYILFVMLLQRIGSRLVSIRGLVREGLVLGLLMITVTNIYIANEAYLNMHLSYENTYAITSTVISQVQSLPDYSADTPVAVLGSFEKPDYYDAYFPRLDALMGAQGISPTIYSIESFWEYYNGYPITTVSQEEKLALYRNEEYLAMPVYPNAGYVRQIDGVIVVKFS